MSFQVRIEDLLFFVYLLFNLLTPVFLYLFSRFVVDKLLVFTMQSVLILNQANNNDYITQNV